MVRRGATLEPGAASVAPRRTRTCRLGHRGLKPTATGKTRSARKDRIRVKWRYTPAAERQLPVGRPFKAGRAGPPFVGVAERHLPRRGSSVAPRHARTLREKDRTRAK